MSETAEKKRGRGRPPSGNYVVVTEQLVLDEMRSQADRKGRVQYNNKETAAVKGWNEKTAYGAIKRLLDKGALVHMGSVGLNMPLYRIVDDESDS